MSTRLTLLTAGVLAGLSALAGRSGSGNVPSSRLGDFQFLLALLRALHLHYHAAHWRAQGPASYGDHLLFERLYEGSGGGPDVQDEIDRLAEWMVAAFGRDAVKNVVVLPMAEKILAGAYRGSECPLTVGLHLERAVQEHIDGLRKQLGASGAPPTGVDDLLSNIAGERETAIYLLQQRQAPAPQGSAARRPRPPRPPISRALAQARLMSHLPPHSDLEYTGTSGRYHRFNFWDENEQRARTVHVTAISERPEHFTVRWD